MKHFFPFCCLLFLFTAQTFAQQTHFIYLQTDNHQPFYVLMKGKNYSSSSIGYVILPKLESGDYRIKIGFAKSETAEQDYIFQINDIDQGFLIKDFGDKGAGVFNLQTMAIQYSGEQGRKLDAVANAKRDAANKKILAQQQKDSTEKAEGLLAEQKKDQLILAAKAEAKQQQEAAALAQQQADASIKAENEARITLEAKQKKDAAALAKQQVADSLKVGKVAKKVVQPSQKPTAAITKQEAAAKALAYRKYWADKKKQEQFSADSLAKLQVTDHIKVENDTKLALAAEQKKAEDAAQQQADDDAKAYKQKQLAAFQAQKQAAAIALQKGKDSLALIEKSKAEMVEPTAQNDLNKETSKQIPSSISVDKTVNATIVYQPVLVAKNASDSGTNITYKIPSNKGWDTVSAYIEAPKSEKKATEATVVPNDKTTDVKFLEMPFKQDSADKKNDMITPVFKNEKPATTPAQATTDTSIKPVVTTIKAEINISEPAKTTETKISSLSKTEAKEIETIPTTNSNCKALADDKDFFALRKKMVAQDDVDKMIILAKKSMKEKCYSTFQMRNLSALMITDADRYQFLEMAYPFVSDANNYSSLVDLLKDTYYANRFKVMLRK